MNDRMYECNCAENSGSDPCQCANCRTSDLREVCSLSRSEECTECACCCCEYREDACALVLIQEGQDGCQYCEYCCCKEAACSDCSAHDLSSDQIAVFSLISSTNFYSVETLFDLEVFVTIVEVAVAVQSVSDANEVEISLSVEECCKTISDLLLTVFVLSKLSLTVFILLVSICKLLTSVCKLSRSCCVIRKTLSVLSLTCCELLLSSIVVVLTFVDSLLYSGYKSRSFLHDLIHGCFECLVISLEALDDLVDIAKLLLDNVVVLNSILVKKRQELVLDRLLAFNELKEAVQAFDASIYKGKHA